MDCTQIKYRKLDNLVFHELRQCIYLFSTLRILRLCVNLKAMFCKDAKESIEKIQLYIDY